MNDHNIEPHQFKPGQSGNPKGRPKGSKNVKTSLKELLASQDPNNEYSVPIVKKLLQLAFTKDDLSALKEIIDRVEGKVPIKSHVSGDMENPLGVIINVTRPQLDQASEDKLDKPKEKS